MMGIRTLVVANSGEVTQKISDVVATDPDFEVLANYRDGFDAQRSRRLLVRSSGRLVFLDVHEVIWIEASDNYVVFHTRTGNHVVRITMSALQNSLDPNVFVRIHRSTILNIEYVRELRAIAHGDYGVVLRDGTELTMTRSYRTLLEKLMPSGQL
jgi:two-component system, LytTR family, response regulator